MKTKVLASLLAVIMVMALIGFLVGKEKPPAMAVAFLNAYYRMEPIEPLPPSSSPELLNSLNRLSTKILPVLAPYCIEDLHEEITRRKLIYGAAGLAAGELGCTFSVGKISFPQMVSSDNRQQYNYEAEVTANFENGSTITQLLTGKIQITTLEPEPLVCGFYPDLKDAIQLIPLFEH